MKAQISRAVRRQSWCGYKALVIFPKANRAMPLRIKIKNVADILRVSEWPGSGSKAPDTPSS